MNRYEEMSDEELRTLAGSRCKRSGCYTRAAKKAQEELYERTHWDTRERRSTFKNCDEPRSIEDIQYNG